ncbi:MAG TPA: TonB-dependent receptor plug domain-containing protein [Vicinamibacterales bacterium]|nr:TonB-dependent receptor plug domain-containing protein [Vicinamibacterales bacterium]
MLRPLLLLAHLLSFDGVQEASELRGTITDSSGRPLSGARVTILTPQRGVVKTVDTATDGTFTVTSLEPGSYLVIARAEGLEERQAAVDVTARAPSSITLALSIAGVRETVSVTASPGTALDVSSTAQAVNVISQADIEHRAPVVTAQAFSEEAGVALQRTSPTMAGVFVRGLTGNKVNVFVDGVRYSNSAQRGGVNTFLDLIDQSYLEGIEVLRGPNSAEYGSDALGGSVQFLSQVPALWTGDGTRLGGQVDVRASTGHRGAAGTASGSVSRSSLALFGTFAAQSMGDVRSGGGLDSHAAVTRFFDVRSDRLYTDRLSGTGFDQLGGMLKVNWTPNANTRIVSSYMATRQDGGNRYDQMLGGDGNLISELNDLTLDLFYARIERTLDRWFDHAEVTYSFNSQREERVNQGGNGNPTATIGHEPERTTANGVQGSVRRRLSPRQSLRLGGEIYFEGLTSDSFNVNPVTGAITPRRPRVPSGATYRNGGVFAQTAVDAVPDRLQLVGALRWGRVRYEASAADAPVVNGAPLWPNDSLTAGAWTFRASAVGVVTDRITVASNLARGYRAPHMTDLGTLGLTGSGFEVSYPDVAGRGATVGSSAAATAISTGEPVAELGPESSLSWDAMFRYRNQRVRGTVTMFVNNVHDNIQKQALILPAGAVGTTLGTEVITAQSAAGTVFVAATPSAVLVRDNFDSARIWGIEAEGELKATPSLTLNAVYTYLRARDISTDLPPNIEGGTPAPEFYLLARFSRQGQRWWVQPYLRIAADQPNLSSLDLADRRTGAERTRASIRSFLLNGATARGWVSAGSDNVVGTADDVLNLTGETLVQIQDRVLGTATSNSLFTQVDGYATLGVRGGLSFGRHQLFVDVDNLTDTNYRGISWGMDAPGVGVNVRYALRF